MKLLPEIREGIAKILLHLIIFYLDSDLEEKLIFFPVDLTCLKMDKKWLKLPMENKEKI